MVSREQFKVTERKLYNYFKKDKKTNSLKRKITLLNKHIEQIEYKLKHVDISIPEESKSMSYEERVQTSSTGESYAERTALKITDRLIIEQSRKIDEISELEEEIRNIEADNIIIEENIKLLRKEDVEFLKSKYDKELPDWEVGINLNMSQSKVTRKRQRLVENIANWEAWTKIVH